MYEKVVRELRVAQIGAVSGEERQTADSGTSLCSAAALHSTQSNRHSQLRLFAHRTRIDITFDYAVRSLNRIIYTWRMRGPLHELPKLSSIPEREPSKTEKNSKIGHDN